MAFGNVLFSHATAAGFSDIGGDDTVVWAGDSAIPGKIYELSEVDLSEIRNAAPPKGQMKSIGGAYNVIYFGSNYAPKDRFYELSEVDFSVVRFAAGVIPNTLQGCGGDEYVIWLYDVGIGRIREHSVVDFSLIRQAAPTTGGLSRIGGKFDVIWWSEASDDDVHELAVADFAVLQTANAPATLPTGSGGDAKNYWHTDTVAARAYKLDVGTPAAIKPITFAATNIQDTQADGNGYIKDATTIDIIGFDWGTAPGVYTDDVQYSGPIFDGNFALTMLPLVAGTNYFFRVKAHDTVLGWLYGSEKSFTTLQPLPTVKTDPGTNIQDYSFDANGEITATGGDPTCDERGFVYDTATHADPGNVAPGASGYAAFVNEAGAFGAGAFSLPITGTTPILYYVRAYAHNSFGYRYGSEVVVLANPNVDILYPAGNYSVGIRFDTSPGGNYPRAPYSGTIPHWILVLSRDSSWVNVTPWGYTIGNHVYERNWYNSLMHEDLYYMTNPIERDAGVRKIKWRAHLVKTSYPYGKYQRHLRTHGVEYSGTKTNMGSATDIDVCEILYTNEFTLAPWTIDELNDIICGIGLGEGGGWGTPSCDWLVIFVLWKDAEVGTLGATDQGGNIRRLYGMVIEDEGEPCTVYFEWGATAAYGNVTADQTKSKGDTFTADVDIGALPGIHFRAVIETLCGETFYSADDEFPAPTNPARGSLDRRLLSSGLI